ncbi:hypothetical protein [Actinomarinicola tropica]|uniref:Uncharacterized protein n=1 Tax=Actinomarinicola tropica TaxID=2789776 RepID=A0A5Q2RIN3_9ACTN|nr:hypothetical protein [Actinomarinicola tropica]QGG94742.1 hypothetical protein GH723_06245 [Actinomarinicola tropica]
MNDEPRPATGTPGEAPDIADGRYDIFVVDADDAPDVGDDAVRLSVTVLAGPHKSHVLDLTARGLGWSSIDLIGMPGTLVVTDGQPSVTIDD